MFQRVQLFGQENAEQLRQSNTGRQLLDNLNRIVADFTLNMGLQVDGEQRSAFESKARARLALREDLLAIARTARSLVRENPDLGDKFRLRGSLADPDLVAHARAFIQYAEPWRSQFVAYALPENFLEDLASDIANFESATEMKSTAIGNRSAAFRSLAQLGNQGRDVVASLDVVVRNIFRGDRLILAAWERATTLDKIPGRGPANGSRNRKKQKEKSAAG